ncbi:MAG: hypothetical protein HZA90_05445 [Verrucomicrobia bacterium]|nr:hypothetical protein [Verrucomicrobiota bacterium]
MKTRLIVAALFLAAQSLLTAAIIEFTVSGTANTTGMGYTAGQSVSFTYTLNDFAPTPPSGDRGSTYVGWFDESTASDPELWSDVRGTGLSGTWTRPATQTGSPYSFLTAQSNPSGLLNLFAGTDTTAAPYDTGITVNGSTIRGIGMDANYSGLSFAIPGTVPDPTAYFGGYLGTYSVASGANGWIDYDGGFIGFTPQNLTITAVPEPATWMAGAFLGVVLLGRHGRRLLGRLGSRA